MAGNDRGGSEAAYQGADDIAERDAAEFSEAEPIFFLMYAIGCRLGVYLLHKFSTAMENTAREVTDTTDKDDVNASNHNAVASSCFASPSPAPNTNPNPGTSPSSSPSPNPNPSPSPSPSVGPTLSPSPDKKENAARDYFKLWVRIVVVYEIIIFSVFVAEIAFGITIDTGLELPSNFHLFEDVITACTYEWRLWNQLWRWRKDLLKMFGRGLRASVARLRCMASGAGRTAIIALWAIGSGIAGVIGLLVMRTTQRWETTQRDNNNNKTDDDGDSNDEEPNSEPAPSLVQITEPPSATETSDNTAPSMCGLPEATPENNTNHLAQKTPDRSCRSPKYTVPPQTPPRTPLQQRAMAESIPKYVDRDRGSAPGSLTKTKNGDNTTGTMIVPINFTSRLPVDQGSEVHCCTVDPQARKEMWVRAQYFEDMDGEAVPGVFAYLPVTVLRPSYSEVSTDQGRKWYVQPGGKEGRKEWSEEDGRVIWEVPHASLFGKTNAESDESCDACRRKGRQCSWTPDKLECLCDYCADAPRRHLDGCGRARDLGFNWARACDCLGQ